VGGRSSSRPSTSRARPVVTAAQQDVINQLARLCH
jgi:hypothetical protein